MWKLVFTLAAFGTVLLSRPYFRPGGNARGALSKPGAFFALLLLCTQGMFALVSATDLLTFYLGLELATLPIFALAAFQTKDADSVEAGSKYVLMGGLSSALLLFGMSFLYGAAGSLDFHALALAARSAPNEPVLWGGVIFLLGGLGFKLAMFPLHMWAPDVYQGAPTPVMAFLSVASKAAAVAALAIVFLGPLDGLRPALVPFFSLAAVLSMAAGNLGAMRQSNLRRFVAYSSVAQVGYMLVAMLGDARAALHALQYNLIVYGATSFALYFIMGVIGKGRAGNPAVPARPVAAQPRIGGLAGDVHVFPGGHSAPCGLPGQVHALHRRRGGGALCRGGDRLGHGRGVLLLLHAGGEGSLHHGRPLGKPRRGAGRLRAAPIRLGPWRTIALWVLAGLMLVLGLCPAAADWLSTRADGVV